MNQFRKKRHFFKTKDLGKNGYLSATHKVAIVHDDFIQNGGAEKLVLCFLEIFPQADLFTSIISEEWEGKLLKLNPNLKISTGFINKVFRKSRLYKSLAILYPISFFLFRFKGYDLVISSTARFAHGIRTDKKTLHIAYVNSPARMLWEPLPYFNKFLVPFLYPFILVLRMWDKLASSMPDVLIANSKTIQNRIKKYWNRDSQIIYPFHDLNKNSVVKVNKGEHFIMVSRLEKWKRIDLAIDACNRLKQKLIIVGEGKYKKALEKTANQRYVKFMGRLSDQDLIDSYIGSKALIMTQKEDFGITSVEAQSFGVPVIAYKSGGASETVIDGKTGIFFENQTIDSLAKAIEEFGKIEIDSKVCTIQADKFAKGKFIRRILEAVNINGKRRQTR